MAPQGLQEKLSSHVALTLALSATAEEAGVGPEKTNGRNPFHCKMHPSPAQDAATSCRVSPWPGCLPPQKQ